MARGESTAVVTSSDGRNQSLGAFLQARKQACGLPVTRLVDEAGLSRANYYLLEKDSHRPSLMTLVALFKAMGLATHLPIEEEPTRSVDLVVLDGSETYEVDLRWSAEERAKSRERYVAVASAGLGTALAAFAPALARFMAKNLGPGLGVPLGPAGVAAASAGALLGGVVGAEAARLRELRAASRVAAESAPTQADVLADLKATAESMSTEELEAMLATMKAMREVRDPERPE